MKRTLSIIFLALLILATGCKLRVERVVDGDTIYLTDGAKIRLYGIDAPERQQPYGMESRKALAGMVNGEIRIEEMDVDRYGRSVSVVWIGDMNVNQEMIRSGMAWVYDRYCRERFCDDWVALEDEARKGRRGLWADRGAVEPWEWRWSREKP